MGNLVIRNVKIKGTLPSGVGDNILTHDASSKEVGYVDGGITSLPENYIFVGNASNEPAAVEVSGAITIDSTGLTALGLGVVSNTNVASNAAIALTKLAATTINRALVSNGSGVISPSTVTLTELGHLSGVTSALQTQLNGKQSTITGAASTVVTSNLTANRVTVSDAGGKITQSTITTTELGRLSGITGNVQTQLNSKLEVSLSSVAIGDLLVYDGSNFSNFPRGSEGQALYSTATGVQWDTPTINGIPIGGTTGQILAKSSNADFDADWSTLTVSSITDLTASAAELNILAGVTVTTTELNRLSGVTSPIQTQLNNKLNNALSYNAIFVGNVTNTPSQLAAGTNNQVLTIIGGVPQWATPSTSGNISGPGSSTNNAIPRWNGTSGDALNNSGVLIDGSNNITGVASLTASTITLSSVPTNDDTQVQVLVRDSSTGEIKYRTDSTFGGGVGVTDGDKGDITVSGTGTVWTIDNDVVTFAKMQNIATDTLIGRDTAGTGDPEAISVTGGIEFNGSGAIRTTAFTGDVTKTAGGTALTISNGVVTFAKMQSSAAGLSVVGRSANTSGVFAEIVAANDGEVLRRNGSNVGFGTIGDSSISDLEWGKLTSVPDASETVKGITELATQAETDAGTDNDRIVTPLKLASKPNYYDGGAFTSAVDLTLTNRKFIHSIAGAIAYTMAGTYTADHVGNIREDYLTANGINKPTFSADFVVIQDFWVNTINTVNVIRFKRLSNNKIGVWLYNV